MPNPKRNLNYDDIDLHVERDDKGTVSAICMSQQHEDGGPPYDIWVCSELGARALIRRLIDILAPGLAENQSWPDRPTGPVN